MTDTEERVARILVVDDEPANVEILEELLEDFNVQSAANGREALQKIEIFEPDLILLDVMMPSMNGYDVCRYIRSRARSVGSTVIFLSAKADAEDIQAGYDSGGDDYITKPFDPMLVLGRVEEHLKTRPGIVLPSTENDATPETG